MQLSCVIKSILTYLLNTFELIYYHFSLFNTAFVLCGTHVSVQLHSDFLTLISFGMYA